MRQRRPINKPAAHFGVKRCAALRRDLDEARETRAEAKRRLRIQLVREAHQRVLRVLHAVDGSVDTASAEEA